MEEAEIIKKAQFSDWAALIVPAVKPDNSESVETLKSPSTPNFIPQHPLSILASLAGGE